MDERFNIPINFLISQSLLQAVDEYATETTRKRSSIIREALAKYLEAKNREKLEELMREGYEAMWEPAYIARINEEY
ncbi:hypothetical protein LCGC14_0679740 [marine sediment metagenome]|uniref:Ribbon-helix-helix protein CopG domain-containing protein n=1 Tax=marine sediment metagenome TaxID=412755 RepID=A0A0F9T9V5_9ZZZZ